MIKHIWSVITQRAIIEGRTNSLSLIDIMEEVTVGIRRLKPTNEEISIINIPLTYEIVSYLITNDEKNIENPLIKIDFINPKGNILKTFEHEIKWEQGKPRMRARITITGLSVNIPGTYIYKISLKEKSEKEFKPIAELPLDIKITEESSPNAQKNK